MPRIRTPNLDSAIRMVRSLDNLLPGPAFNNMIRTLNQSWGFADELGDISGKNGFWNDAGVAKIGTMPVPDFMRLSKKAKLDFLESDAFSPTARTRMGDAVNANFTSKFDDVARAGQDGLRKAKADMMEPNGRTVKNQPMFNQFMDKFGTAMKLTAAAALVTWTASELQKLVDAGSGCFLVGPEGEEMKVSSGNCSCGDAANNPNAEACCAACVGSGDSFTCPGDAPWSGDGPAPPEWVCPSEPQIPPPPGRARAMRASLSVAAATATGRAAALAHTPRNLPPTPAATSECVPCGCESAKWGLCQRNLGVFDVIGDLLASVGKAIVDVGGGVLDISEDVLGGLLGPLSGIMKIILISVGVAAGLAVIIGVTVVVLKKKKRKKLRAP